jgi:hypothetical protein
MGSGDDRFLWSAVNVIDPVALVLRNLALRHLKFEDYYYKYGTYHIYR